MGELEQLMLLFVAAVILAAAARRVGARRNGLKGREEIWPPETLEGLATRE